MTDPIADMLTRIRNANRIHRGSVEIPLSKVKIGIAEVLKREGYIEGFMVYREGPQGRLQVKLKFGPEGEKVINRIQRTSKPGRRIYTKIADLKPVLNGLGISILSTSKGILSDREAREKNVGGEILCTIW
jgi:small subunit ribosomal protein S8